MLSKASLRRVLTARRQIIADKDIKNNEIAQKFLSFFYESNFSSLFTYVSMNSEVDTKVIIKTLFDNYTIYAPLTLGNMRQYKLKSINNLTTDKRGNLDFTKYDFDCPPADVAVVPLLGFNSKLFRIGYGGGYYDKFLATFSGVKVGLAYDEQAQEFKNELLDVKMDIIITPTKVIKQSENS